MRPPRFAGRELELATLRQWHGERADRPTVVVMSGTGGVGKTALALRWLHEISEEFPHGRLFVDLGGDSVPVPPEQALAWLLESLGVPGKQIPADTGQRAALFRSVTADRQLAILLDNAVSAAQVRSLLPAGPGNIVIVTSRSHLSGLALDGALFLEIAPMSATEALTVLQDMVGTARVSAERDAAHRLVDLCGGLPLVVSIVGARLASRPRRRIADEAATLVDRTRVLTLNVAGGEKSVGAILATAYAGLAERTRLLYRVGAVHPGREFGAAVLAATLGWDETRTSDALAELADLNLIIEVDDQRYSYHDLVRVHARHHAEMQTEGLTSLNATIRMVTWYVTRAVAADLIIHPLRPHVGPLYAADHQRDAVFSNEQDAMSWLERERANLHAVVDHAWEHALYDLAWQMCEALWGLFLRTRRYSDWIATQTIGIASAEQCGNQRAEARLRSQLGFAYAKLSRYDEAVAENMRALELADAIGDNQGRATALSQLGRAALGTQQLSSALRYFQQARDVHEELGRPRGIALNRRRIGNVLTRMGDLDAAVVELRASADAMSSLGDQHQYVRSLQFLGTAHQLAGRHDLADAAVQEAWTVVAELDSPYYRAEVLAQVGEMAEQRGDRATARDAYRKAEELYELAEDPHADLMRSRADLLSEACAQQQR